jgi:hypothetical protein
MWNAGHLTRPYSPTTPLSVNFRIHYCGIAGFEKKAYFKAAEGADKAPVVEF